MKKLAVMTSGRYPCVRVGKIVSAMLNHGWEHDVISFASPNQLEEVYRSLFYDYSMSKSEYVAKLADHPSPLIHVHNEPNWPVAEAKKTGKPVIYNVHDVHSARPETYIDPHEEEAFAKADAYVFISEEQKEFAAEVGYSALMEGKPYVIMPNFATSRSIVERKVFDDEEGVVYAGGLQARGAPNAWRDLSEIVDVCEEAGVPFHIYPGNSGVDYGIVHETVYEYGLLTANLARYQWGFSGNSGEVPAWTHSVPNKVFEYLAAGIPFIAYQNPLLRPLCDAGLGIYVDDIRHIPKAAQADPKPFAKRVKEQRNRFTMEANIDPLVELYESLCSSSSK